MWSQSLLEKSNYWRCVEFLVRAKLDTPLFLKDLWQEFRHISLCSPHLFSCGTTAVVDVWEIEVERTHVGVFNVLLFLTFSSGLECVQITILNWNTKGSQVTLCLPETTPVYIWWRAEKFQTFLLIQRCQALSHLLSCTTDSAKGSNSLLKSSFEKDQFSQEKKRLAQFASAVFACEKRTEREYVRNSLTRKLKWGQFTQLNMLVWGHIRWTFRVFSIWKKTTPEQRWKKIQFLWTKEQSETPCFASLTWILFVRLAWVAIVFVKQQQDKKGNALHVFKRENYSRPRRIHFVRLKTSFLWDHRLFQYLHVVTRVFLVCVFGDFNTLLWQDDQRLWPVPLWVVFFHNMK